MQDTNCLFCGIVSGKIRARIISQNDNAIAFLDAFPLSAGHTLVIPKLHYYKIQDMDRKCSSAVFSLLWKVVAIVEATVEVNASTIAIHNGKEAGQEVRHVHIHIIPRTGNDGAGPIHSMFNTRPKLSDKEMDLILEKMKKNF
jgi:histidine triad (HIT) family protein